jgi:3-oxoacyl-[acyl-carrier protein] reductase
VVRFEVTCGRMLAYLASSRGIGAGIAIALARAGASVAVNYRERADAAIAKPRQLELPIASSMAS